MLAQLAALFIHISWSKCCLFVCLCVCLDVSQGGTNHNHCTQRLVICIHGATNEPDRTLKTRSV